MSEFGSLIASKLNIRQTQVEAVIELLEESATIPFIARYRKDKTGGLDEVQIQQIQDEQKFFKEITERRTFIIKTIEEQGKMTEALMQKLQVASTMSALEDIYLPFKPKRKTKAQTARENGLEPLAKLILEQSPNPLEPELPAFLNEQVSSIENALQGARDIIAEWVNEDAENRAKLRKLFEDAALLQSKVLDGKETEGVKYKDYFDFTEPIHKIPSHRILAVLRGFLEGFLRMAIQPMEEDALELLEKQYIKGFTESSTHVKKAVSYTHLTLPTKRIV